MNELDQIRKKIILVVDDDTFFLEIVRLMLDNMGFKNIETAQSYDEAKQILQQKKIDLVLLDIHLNEEKSGVDIAKDIRIDNMDLPIVFMTAVYDEKVYESVQSTNPFSFLNKNMSQIQLRQAVELPLVAQIRNAAQTAAQRQAAAATNRIKEEFIASMNHQIRTPMNAIIGLTELLLESAPSQFQEALKDLQFAGENLMKILRDIIDLAQLKQGQVVLAQEAFELESSLQNLLHKYRKTHKNPQVSLQLTIQGRPPKHYLIGDLRRLEQALSYLIDNGLKYTEAGYVKVIAEVEEMTENATHATVKFSVVDTGKGIATEKRTMIFESFSEIAEVKEQQFAGSGLGLSIAQHLIALHGAQLQVDSVLGKGSAFHFKLQFPIGNALETFFEQELKGVRILLVEDNLLNQKLAQKALEQKGVEVTTADNGAFALEIIKKTNFDMVLMDLNMPVMDGLEATQKIRALASTMAHIPIIVVTSSSPEQVHSNMQKLGINALLIKPFKPNELYELINRTLAKDNVEE